jgi:hypothetical protein
VNSTRLSHMSPDQVASSGWNSSRKPADSAEPVMPIVRGAQASKINEAWGNLGHAGIGKNQRWGQRPT